MASTVCVINDTRWDARRNMAADRFLLNLRHEPNTAFLRLYTWRRPTISLGYMQQSDILDCHALRHDGVEWVQRPTGGRAVFHWCDLTYSVVFPAAFEGVGDSIRESYRMISRCLMHGLRLAQIVAEPHDSELDSRAARTEIKLPCFLAPNREELMVGGRKLVGSAQKRTNRGLLQHGSFPLTPDFRRLPNYLRLTEEQRVRQRRLLGEKCACLQELAPPVDATLLRRSLARGFGETLGCALHERAWTSRELTTIARLAEQVASSSDEHIPP